MADKYLDDDGLEYFMEKYNNERNSQLQDVFDDLDGKISSYSGLKTYSSSEVEVGTWLNGQTIYRKVISGTPSAQNSNVQHGVTNFGAPINCYGFYKRNSDGAFEPIPRNIYKLGDLDL